jgi:catechol 2,3-dioxygenase-like lactoylglutathione lyase family enzyme
MITLSPYLSSPLFSLPLASFLPALGDTLFSTQGIMVMLLGAYAAAMWMFLSSAPKVYTIMVSDLQIAKGFYEGLLNLPVAEVPLHYYYNYEQTLGTTGFDTVYFSNPPQVSSGKSALNSPEGLWYQLKKNTQVHIISGASLGYKNRQRHVCFDRDCLEQILLRIQSRRLKYRVRREKPLNFLVKDLDEKIIEMAEVSS